MRHALLFLLFLSLSFSLIYPQNMPGIPLILSWRTIPEQIQPGDTHVILQVDLTHVGSRNFDNITIQARFSKPFVGVNDTYFIQSMKYGDRYTASFVFNIDGDCLPGAYVIPIYIKGYDPENGWVDGIRYVMVEVSTAGKFEITSIENQVKNNTIETKVCVANVGSITIGEMLISIDGGQYVTYIPNLIYLDNLPAQEERCVIFKGIIDKNYVAGTYIGKITIANRTNSFFINLPEKPKLIVSSFTWDEDPIVGEKRTLSIEVQNIGKGEAKAVQIIIEGDVVGNREGYVGNVDEDDSGTAIFSVIPLKEGQNTLNVTIKYLVDNKTVYQKTSITFYVFGKSHAWIYGVIIIVLAIGFFVLRKKKWKI